MLHLNVHHICLLAFALALKLFSVTLLLWCMLVRASPTVMQLDFAFFKFAKNLKNCSPTVLHLTYAFWQTWHLMDQTWHFGIGTMAWQF